MPQESRTPSVFMRTTLRLTASISCLAAASFGLSVSANAATYSVLYSLTGKPNDGANCNCAADGTLVQDKAGNLYGTTNNGGPYDFGTAFEIDPAGNETVLTNFQYDNGSFPQPGLIRHKGILYDTTFGGGYNGYGAVVRINDRGRANLLYSFCSLTNCTDGALPLYGVTRDSVGNLYGTTSAGGAYSAGVVFKVDPTGNETALYSFCPGGGNCSDGGYPIGGAVRDSTGNLYGVAQSGPNSDGVVWKLDTSGNESVLHAFTGAPTDGLAPRGLLAIDGSGNLYGVTNVGGSGTACGQSGCGTVFKVDASGNETVLHSFTGTDGAIPNNEVLVLDKKGNLYGTALNGGAYNYGTVFKLSPSGKFKVLYSFQGKSDGGNPSSGLLLDRGVLYGETDIGGDLNCSEGNGAGCGVVFKITTP